jgi:hypothetical protein
LRVFLEEEDYGHVPAGVAPVVIMREPIALPVATETAPGAMVGAAIVARIHPRGLPCTWVVEYGPTAAYGTTTAVRALPGKLSAHYLERWSAGPAGYLAGINRNSLSHQPEGYVRYQAEGIGGDDDNHTNGIGMIQLPLCFHPGIYEPPDVPRPLLGGGFPDFRGAQMEVRMRGSSWLPKGTDLSTWVQVDLNDAPGVRRANWACTGARVGCRLDPGEWQRVKWHLPNNPHQWTYAGRNNSKPPGYFYKELDATLRDVNVNIFPVQILDIDTAVVDRPTGRIEFDSIEITYRQHNLCAISNGGTLTSSPAGSTGASLLTDGWRNGTGREWRSAVNPSSPQDFVFSFATPVVVSRVQIHNAVASPSRAFEVALSTNGTVWTTVATGELPQTSVHGQNFMFTVADTFSSASWSYMRVRITSGWQADRWALGEIEAFGTGASEQTENDWYDVNQDLALGSGTYHYRVVATTSAGITYGPDQTLSVS